MNEPLHQVANDLMTLRHLIRPNVLSLSNTCTLAVLRLLIDSLANLLLAIQTIDERTNKP